MVKMKTKASLHKNKPAEVPARERILEAARQEFTVHGKAGARMDRIAGTAAVNKAMLYYYYSSKDNLYHEVLLSFFELAFRGLEKVLATDHKVEDKVRRLISYYIDYYEQNARFVRLLLREMADGGQEVLAVLKDYKQAKQSLSPQVVIDFFAKGIRDEVFRPLDARHVVLSIVGMCVFMFMCRPILPIMMGIDPEQPDAFQQRKLQVSELLLKGLLNPKHRG
jgi:TetR/AcrR family transcriptional regulator